MSRHERNFSSVSEMQAEELTERENTTRSILKEWIKKSMSFRYTSDYGNVSCYADSRGYYLAVKRVGGELRRKRIGRTYEQIMRNIEEASAIICTDELWLKHKSKNKDPKDIDARKLTKELAELRIENAHLKKAKNKLELRVRQLLRDAKG